MKGVGNMAEIKSVLEVQYTRKEITRNTECEYEVIYISGRRVKYGNRKTLPISVLNFILSGNVEANVRYIHNNIGPLGTVKQTKYTRR